MSSAQLPLKWHGWGWTDDELKEEETVEKNAVYIWSLRKVQRGETLGRYSFIFSQFDDVAAKEWFKVNCQTPGQSYAKNPEAFMRDYPRRENEVATDVYWEVSCRKVMENEWGLEIP